MQVKSFFIVSLGFLLICFPARAGEKSKPKVENIYEMDESGLIYSGGVDMNPPSSELPEVGIGAPVSVGCGRFDFGLNLKNAMTAEAMQDYVSTLGANVLAASPWLLLEYINPTYADALKHIQGISYQRLPGLYNDCETIVAEGTDLIHKLKKASDAGKINSGKEGGDISGEMRKLKETADLAGLKDYNGNLIGNREHRLIKEGLEWAKAPDEIIEFSDDIAGDILISGKSVKESSVKTVFPKEDISHFLSSLKDEIYLELVKLMKRRERGEFIPANELATVSSDSIPLTNMVLRSWSAMNEKTRKIEIGKYASAVAVAQLSNRVFTLVDKIRIASSNIYKSDVEKELLNQKASEVKNRVLEFRELRGEEKVLASTVSEGLNKSASDMMDLFDSQVADSRKDPVIESMNNEGFLGE